MCSHDSLAFGELVLHHTSAKEQDRLNNIMTWMTLTKIDMCIENFSDISITIWTNLFQ